ncbi:hypothetical protein KRX19_11470 [Cardiobacteriaceae bacterium TAE3-ERU3]|nr:hypothetical protein [Cardiobacteriaceae bacterium TAE3-ERU3]
MISNTEEISLDTWNTISERMDSRPLLRLVNWLMYEYDPGIVPNDIIEELHNRLVNGFGAYVDILPDLIDRELVFFLDRIHNPPANRISGEHQLAILNHVSSILSKRDNFSGNNRILYDRLIRLFLKSFSPPIENSLKPSRFKRPFALILIETIDKFILPNLARYTRGYPDSVYSAEHLAQTLFYHTSRSYEGYTKVRYREILRGQLKKTGLSLRMWEKIKYLNFSMTIMHLVGDLSWDNLVEHHTQLFSPHTDSDREEDATLIIEPRYEAAPFYIANAATSTLTTTQQTHISNRALALPSAPYRPTAEQYQEIFAVLSQGTQANDRGAAWHACLLISLITGVTIHTLLSRAFQDRLADKIDNTNDPVIYLMRSRYVPLHVRYQTAENKKHLYTNAEWLPIPIPTWLCTVFLNHRSNRPHGEDEEKYRINVMRSLERIRKFHLKPRIGQQRVTTGAIEGCLHTVLFRYTGSHHYADIICGVPARRSIGLYYTSDNIGTILNHYQQAIDFLANGQDFSTRYIEIEAKRNQDYYVGSRVAMRPGYAKNLMKRLYDDYTSETHPIARYNRMIIYVWHALLLLTGARTINESPGRLKSYRLNGRPFVMLDDKNSRSVRQPRYVPLATLAVQIISQYKSLLQELKRRANTKMLEGIENIELSKSTLLAFLGIKHDEEGNEIYYLKPVRVSLIQIYMNTYHNMPLNWSRHFLRTAMAHSHVNENIINQIFGHENPQAELVAHISSASIADLEEAREFLNNLADDLDLRPLHTPNTRLRKNLDEFLATV